MASNTPPPQFAQIRPLLTVKDVAGLLRLHPRSVRRLIADGRLPVVRLRGAVRIRPEDVEDLVTRSGQERKNYD